ncbi:MAG: lamin tail domain-containing protein [Flammeovirgaceae bacterium]|nr:lamin tail domain-containing protein [Flammeovirgaceae bacterium]
MISELIPELALLNKENPKEVFLYFNQELAENKTLEIQGINLEDIFGNQIDKAISQNFIIDTKKPSINTTGSIFPINQNQLELHFTESLTIGSANILNNYEIKEDIGFPSLAIRDSTDYSIVHLFFEENLGQEKVYDITIRNVSDLSGNVISTKTRSFILDQKAPELVDLRVFSIHELKLFFSESLLVDSAMLSANYWVNQGLGNPDSIFIYPYNTKVAHLFFENSLPEKDSLLIEISNLEDHYGNVLIKPDSVYFNTKLPSVAVLTVLSDKMLEVKFSKKIDKENLSVLISGGIESPKNVTYQKTDSSTLIMELNGVLTEDSIYTINLENVSDFSGNIKLTIKKSFIFNPIVEQVEVVESNVINLYFEEELHPEYPLKNTDYSLNSQAIFPLLVFLDQENHQLLTLVFEENFPADKTLKLLISPQMKKDGEFSPESNINFIYDLKSPEITKIEAIYNELTITFSEPVEKISATALNHYWINEGVGNPIDFDYQNDTTVSLFFKNNFEVKNHYSLTIESVEDMAGNTIPDTAYNFKIYPNPRSNQLIITEIMADPSPVVGLPDTEYIEVWNVTEDTFNLAGMKLVDATGETGFPNFLIYPNDYVILCASGNFSQFMALGKTLSLISFPSLNNSGEILKIISPVGKVINEVNYTDDWYGNPEKTDGGWSLEIIDPFNFCSEKENWKASENSLGGTPGEINSLMASNPDTIAPKFLEWVILNDSTVNLVFSERMDTVSLLISENYEISGEMDFEINLSNDVKSVELVFSGRLEKGKNYQITLADLADKCGNYLLDFSFDVILPEQPAYNEIIVTEIFADPNPSVGLPEFEYLEIYNSTDKTFDLGDLKLEVGEDQLKMNTSILQPFEYVVLTSNSGRKSLEKYGRTIGITNWIALKNTGDQIVLRNKNGELIFEITYQDDWYADIDKEDGGFSLEMKNVTQPCLASENWEASENAIGGTPGSENSLKNDQIRDDFPPELQKGYVIDELNIQLIFDGKLDSFSVVNALTKLKPEIGLKKLIFDYQNPKEVRLELESPLIEKIRYRVGIKDLQDCSGNTNVNWQYLILVLPEEADSSDILISEVLFNPPVGGIDFVEIYNNSDKHIDLKNWMIGNGKTEEIISEKPIIIAPNNFLTLTSDISQLKTQHPVGADSTFFETKLPSFNDKEGMVILKNSSGNIIDEFSYHEDFHNSALDDKNGVSLERINYSQPTNTPDNWTSAAETIGFATPGYRNSQHNDHQFFLSEDCFEVYPQVIIPDLDGIDDYAILNYGCLNSGSLATIIIYDAFGREIKSILNNQLIPVDGQFIWDGTNRQGQKVSMGNYIIQISLIEANGTSKEFRKNVAVGTRF